MLGKTADLYLNFTEDIQPTHFVHLHCGPGEPE